jgi:hypothetical protein
MTSWMKRRIRRARERLHRAALPRLRKVSRAARRVADAPQRPSPAR